MSNDHTSKLVDKLWRCQRYDFRMLEMAVRQDRSKRRGEAYASVR